MNNIFLTTFITMLTLFSMVTADVPQTINYQGILSNSDGTLVADGNYNVTFAIYDAETEGSQLWSETHEGISVTGGLFNVLLGSTNPLAIAFDVPCWLSVSMGESESSSRIQMAATPYSLNTRSVSGNTGFGVVPIGSILPWHKSFNLTPNLPDGWAECNGQVVSDESSPYYEQTMPDLNNSGRFIRGGVTSGNIQSGDVKPHTHPDDFSISNDGNHDHDMDWTYGTGSSASGMSDWGVVYGSQVWPSTEDAGTHDHPINGGVSNNTGSETRPINMSVVWIMRIR